MANTSPEPGVPAYGTQELAFQPPGFQPPAPTARGGGIVLLRTFGVLLAVGILLAGTASVVIHLLRQSRTTTTTVPGQVTRLVADTGTGDIRIKAGEPGAPTTVTRKIQWVFSEPSVTVQERSGVLTLGASCPRNGFSSCNTDFTVTVPAGTALDVTTGTGEVSTSGISGAVSVTTGVGDISLAESSSTNVLVKTGTGEVTLSGDRPPSAPAPGSAEPAGGTVSVETGPGDVVLTDVAASNVKVRTGGGQVTVSGGTPGGRVEARSGVGDVKIELRETPAGVTVHTGAGEIDVIVPTGTSYAVDTHSGTGETAVDVRQDDAAPRKIILDSGVGDITVRARAATG
ncbi:MAG: hypothetical protein QG622_1584 [Actinomycetota bacterium]|nr:hypothetical protein [Actinomycetota bacterium]